MSWTDHKATREIRPLYFIIVFFLMMAAGAMTQAASVGRHANYLVRADSADQIASDEEFRLYGSDFAAQQFIADARIPQTPKTSYLQTHFLYSPSLNAFKLPSNIPLGGGLHLFASVSFLQRAVTLDDHQIRTHGMGDLTVGGGWNGDLFGRLYFQTRAFAKLPTGDRNAVYSEYRLPLGTGSTDFGGTVQLQARLARWAYLVGGLSHRMNGIGETINQDQTFSKTRRGVETGRILGLAIVPGNHISITAKWAEIQQGATRIYEEDESYSAEDAQITRFLIPELAVYVGDNAQMTLQAHLPAGSTLTQVAAWNLTRDALIDFSVSAYF